MYSKLYRLKSTDKVPPTPPTLPPYKLILYNIHVNDHKVKTCLEKRNCVHLQQNDYKNSRKLSYSHIGCIQ